MIVNRNITMTWWERIYLPEIFRGLYVTTTHFFRNMIGFIPALLSKDKKRKIFTVYYPDEKVEYPAAYRGRPVLVLNENGIERCVACGLCEVICPAKCIEIQPAETELEKERYPESFSINMARCIFCGFCEEVCPKEAIVMSDECEIADLDRNNMFYEKDQLLISENKLQKRLNYIKEIYGKWNY
tara:strand:+ start:11816 stop:12370 length:555 start_codon:yes stop_codon:yes gene_type:complete